MSLTIDLTEDEESRLQQLAAIRGIKPEDHAHLLLTNILASVPNPEEMDRTRAEEQKRLVTAVKAGNADAWHRLLHMAPAVAALDPMTGDAAVGISDQALRREYIYEDRV